MGGFSFASSKGLGHGSSFYVCVPHKQLENNYYSNNVEVATIHSPVKAVETGPSSPKYSPSNLDTILLADVNIV
jgi:hypothetical protein